ncbi:MAG TPA: hypothetical protein VFD92_19505 [Candidatus Binatia bacterium]|nr:hypothetical protein [Candidatus Binatia bacterium]
MRPARRATVRTGSPPSGLSPLPARAFGRPIVARTQGLPRLRATRSATPRLRVVVSNRTPLAAARAVRPALRLVPPRLAVTFDDPPIARRRIRRRAARRAGHLAVLIALVAAGMTAFAISLGQIFAG